MVVRPLVGVAVFLAASLGIGCSSDSPSSSQQAPDGGSGGSGTQSDASSSAGSGGGGGGSSGTCRQEGTYRCAGKAQAKVERCEQGRWTVAQECGGGTLCDSSLPVSTSNRCRAVAPECEGKAPGEIVCLGSNRVRCSDDLLESTVVAECATPDLCKLGTGESCAACMTGEYQCDGTDLRTCSADHTGFTLVEVCNSAAACNAEMGACTDSVCTTGMHRCEGAVLQACNAAQDGWEDVTTCDAAALCDAAHGRCNACIPETLHCKDETTLATCRADGQGYDETSCTVCSGAGSCCTKALEVCTDACGGTCEDGDVCTGGTCCTPTTAACDGATCGETVLNNCDQEIECTTCGTGACTCGGEQTCNGSGCCADPPEVTCAGKCGPQTNNCGDTLDCGCCGNGDCGTNQVCRTDSDGLKCCAEDQPLTCKGKTCGDSYPDELCGVFISCTNCEHCNCPGGQVCKDGSCCTPEPKSTTCGGSGYVGAKCGGEKHKNNCGQTVDCGSCGQGLECGSDGLCKQRECTFHEDCGSASGAGPGWACCQNRCEKKCRDYLGAYWCDNECKSGAFEAFGSCGTSPNCTTN